MAEAETNTATTKTPSVTAEFIAGRKQAFAEIKDLLVQDHDRHAPHGVWHLSGPVDQPMEVDALARDFGADVITNLHNMLDVMGEGYSLYQATAKMHVDHYTLPEGTTNEEGRISAINDTRFLLAMMNLQGLGARAFSSRSQTINPENHEATNIGLKNYAMGMMANFMTDLRKMEVETRKNMPAEPAPPKKKREISFKAFFNYMMGPSPKTATSGAAHMFNTLPKCWPPSHRSTSEAPLYADATAESMPVTAKDAPDGAGFDDGLMTGLRTLYYGLQSFHFQSLARDGYIPIMPTETERTHHARALSMELFHTVRTELQDHITGLPEAGDKNNAGTYQDGIRHSAVMMGEILSGLEGHPKIGDDKEMSGYAWKLVNHWRAHSEDLIHGALNGTADPLPPRRTGKRNMSSRPAP